MNMQPTARAGEYAEPVTANRNQPPAQSVSGQDPAAYLTGRDW